MGCDIHAAVEWRRHVAGKLAPHGHVSQDDWWVGTMSVEFMPRNYPMFGYLVDGHSRAREGQRGVAPERGLPPKPSDITQEVENHRAYPDDGYAPNGVCHADHTFSWLTPEEYHRAIEMYEAEQSPSWGPLDVEWHALDAYLQRLAQAGEVRLVIGFDN